MSPLGALSPGCDLIGWKRYAIPRMLGDSSGGQQLATSFCLFLISGQMPGEASGKRIPCTMLKIVNVVLNFVTGTEDSKTHCLVQYVDPHLCTVSHRRKPKVSLTRPHHCYPAAAQTKWGSMLEKVAAEWDAAGFYEETSWQCVIWTKALIMRCSAFTY